MHVIEAYNIDDAYAAGMNYLRSVGVRENSRAGEVIVSPVPVTTKYIIPQNRVLFNPARDANPFFHLLESVWMLAGWNDARWLDQFVKNFSSRFAEDDGKAHGAYGHRWRHHWGNQDGTLDQLLECSRILYENPETRQAVLAMWDPMKDLGAKKRDIPCNDLIMFRHRNGYLDMTVACRSNDIIWGAYGANAVHMSVLHEWMSAAAGLQVGYYYQVSNNYHAYTALFDKLSPVTDTSYDTNFLPMFPQTNRETLRIMALDTLQEMEYFMDITNPYAGRMVDDDPFGNAWVSSVVVPVYNTWCLWSEGRRTEALQHAAHIRSPDWRQACTMWMQRRIDKAAAVQETRDA